MKRFHRLAALAVAALMALTLSVPALAAFDQDVLNGIVLIRTPAPLTRMGS